MSENETENTQTTEIAEEKPKFDGLSNREAAAKAIEKHGAPREEMAIPEPKTGQPAPTPTKTEVKKELSEELEPPAEFSAVGKKAWKDKDIAGIQKEYRRIHDARTQELSRAQTEAQRARNEGKTWRDLGDKARPYIEARGREGVTPEQAIMEALSLIDEFKRSDPAGIKAELKKIGIDLDAPAKTSGGELSPELKAEITGLRTELNSIKQEKEAQKMQQLSGMFDSVFSKMASEKTRDGSPIFPFLHLGGGIKVAPAIGSLALDAEFQRGVLSRIPNADFETVVREAAAELGLKVSGEAAKVSTSNQQHIDKARRAAAATPGRAAAPKDNANLVGKLGNRAALIQAYRDHQGH